MTRYCLSIGISNYAHPGHRLANPRNDAQSVAQAVRAREFEVNLQVDADSSAISASLDALRQKVEADAGDGRKSFCLIYFAGHAVEVNGASFVLPADFPDQVSPSTIGLQGWSALALIDAIASCAGPKVLIIDGCRVPTAGWTPYEVDRFAQLVSEQRVQFQQAANADNLLIAFSTSPGSEAGDGRGRNSIYSEELCKALLRHDLSIEEVLSLVGQRVIERTSSKQRPWYQSSLTKKTSFTDLPSYTLTHALPTRRTVASSTRIHTRAMDDAVVYHDDRSVFEVDVLELRRALTFKKELAAIAVHDEHLFAVLADGEMYFITGDDRQIAQVGCEDIFGIEVAPNGEALVVFGSKGCEVFVREDGVWNRVWNYVSQDWSIYGATFRSADSMYLCGSGGTLRFVQQLRKTPTFEDLNTGVRFPLYDVEVMTGAALLVACGAKGLVHFFDLNHHKLLRQTDLGRFGQSKIDIYQCLRADGMSGDDALSFVEDPEGFKLPGGAEDDALEYIVQKLPSNNLLCCAITRDPRLLAVGASDGFIYLVDIRDGVMLGTLDVGGSRGVKLQWMCCSALDGSISALGFDGVMFRFGCLTA